MREVFAEHRPGVVFHAAAYKHVGLMELNPVEAVRNNALATRLVARVAGESGVKRFVLVSTDKAVQPATVMGASKALAEFAVEAAQQRWPETKFATVRFGNVLGSSGSVVPIFRRQIALGGPVTVTDERMTRYFMTIPEAVQLVIRAGSLGDGRRGLRPRDGRAGLDHAARPRHDRALGARARARHRHRGRRPPPGREAARGPVQPLRAPPADARREDHAGRAAIRSIPRRRGDVRRDRAARARGRRGRPGGQGRRALGRAAPTPQETGDAPPYGPSPSITPFMTALLAAFSLQDKIEQYGAYAGIAAVFGLGVLSLLYFAQAREVKRLREWAGRAPERAAEIEARVDGRRPARVAPAPRGARRGPPRRRHPPPSRRGADRRAPGAARAGDALRPPPAATGRRPRARRRPRRAAGAPTNGDREPTPPVAAAGREASPPTASRPRAPAAAGAAKAASAPRPRRRRAPRSVAGGRCRRDGAAGRPRDASPASRGRRRRSAGRAAAGGARRAAAPGADARARGGAGGHRRRGRRAARTHGRGRRAAAARRRRAARAAAPLRAPTPSASLPPRTPAGARPRPRRPATAARAGAAAIARHRRRGRRLVAVVAVGRHPALRRRRATTAAPKPNTSPSRPGRQRPPATAARRDGRRRRPSSTARPSPLAVLNGTTVTGLARGAADKLTPRATTSPTW